VDTNTGQRAIGRVDAAGNYSILGLRPSTYSVSVQGKQAQTTTLLVGQTVTLDFAEARTTTAGGSAIVVTGRRTAQPVQAQTVATNVSPTQIENLPQNQRNFLSFAALAPGITIPPGGTAQIKAGAIASSNVNVLLDGMSFKNPINHGGVFGQNFGLGNPFPQIAIQEYQVQTQNFGAETGQAGSAVLTAITKTGGNQFHGSAFIEYQPKAFISKTRFTHGPKPDYNRKQFGGEFSGPIIPGKLTFYVAGEGTIESLPGSVGNVTAAIPQNIAAEVNVPHNFDFKQGLYFGKLTFFATDADTMNLSGYVRRENNLSDIDANAAPSHGRTILTHQTRGQFQWRHSSGDFVNLLNIAYDKGTQSTPSVGTGPEYLLTAGPGITDAIVQLGAHNFNQGDTQKTWTIRNDATLRRGKHTFKVGGQLAFMNLSRTVNDHFNGTYFFTNPGAVATFDPTTATPWGGKINIAPSPSLKGKDTQLGLYVQDEWKPDIHWTINAGLRWDFESNSHNNNYVTPPAIADALRNFQGWAARGINPEDYISTGNNRHPFYGEFQPRLGISYDFKGDKDLVLFGGAGRYYDRTLFIEGVIESLTNANNVVTYNFNGACNVTTPPAYCTDPEALRTFLQGQNFTGGSVFLLNNKTKMPYSDQFDIGLRKRIGDIQTSITFSHIRSRNIFMYVRANFYDNGWYSRLLLRDAAGNVIGCANGGDVGWIIDNTPSEPIPNCAATGGQLPGFSGKLDRGTSSGKANYNAVYLQAEKPFTNNSRWGFTTALTISDATSNIANELEPSDEYFLGPNTDAYGTQRVLGTERWRWVSSAIARTPLDFIVSGQLTLSSGPSFGNIQPTWNSALTFPEGASAKANFGGILWPKKTIGYKRLDLRVAKTFKMPWGHELTADFEVFNVFNWLNRNYTSWDAGQGDNPPRVFRSQVNNDQREFQAGLRYKF
jgi:outer membrane receptor protein involved in Fe transport